MLAYLELMGIASAAQRTKYLGLVQRLDAVYFDYRAAQAATKVT